MLCVNKYKQEHIDECRSNMESQFASYRTLLAAAKAKLICTSLLQNHGMMRTDKTNPTKADVLCGLQVVWQSPRCCKLL